MRRDPVGELPRVPRPRRARRSRRGPDPRRASLEDARARLYPEARRAAASARAGTCAPAAASAPGAWAGASRRQVTAPGGCPPANRATRVSAARENGSDPQLVPHVVEGIEVGSKTSNQSGKALGGLCQAETVGEMVERGAGLRLGRGPHTSDRVLSLQTGERQMPLDGLTVTFCVEWRFDLRRLPPSWRGGTILPLRRRHHCQRSARSPLRGRRSLTRTSKGSSPRHGIARSAEDQSRSTSAFWCGGSYLVTRPSQ